MQQYAVEVTKVLGLGAYSRMDFLLDSREQMYCLEANTLPGMTPTSLLPQEAQAVGVSFEQLCEKLIELSLKKICIKFLCRAKRERTKKQKNVRKTRTKSK